MNFNERFQKWPFKVPSCLIDTFACPIEEPYLCPWDYYNRKLGTTAILYEVVLSLGTKRIVSFTGPFKGKAHDKTICENFTMRHGFIRHGEKAMADKAYNNPALFMFPRRGFQQAMSREDRRYNYLLYRVRQAVERVIRRARSFQMMNVRWRFDFRFHADCSFAIAKLVNASLLFEPLG